MLGWLLHCHPRKYRKIRGGSETTTTIRASVTFQRAVKIHAGNVYNPRIIPRECGRNVVFNIHH